MKSHNIFRIFIKSIIISFIFIFIFNSFNIKDFFFNFYTKQQNNISNYQQSDTTSFNDNLIQTSDIINNFHLSPKEDYKPLFKVETPKKEEILNKHLIKKIIFENYHIPKDLYIKICKNNQEICDKIFFEDIFEADKYNYGTLIIYFIKKIDQWIKPFDFKNNLYFIKIIDDPGIPRRGMSTHHVITINVSNIDSYEEFWNILTHEAGHIVDLGVIKGTYGEKEPFFTEFGKSVFFKSDISLDFYKISWLSEKDLKNNASFEDFVSGYSKTNPFEDWAESFNVYLNHNKYFRYLAGKNIVLLKKLKYFDKLLNYNYFFDDLKNYKKVKNNPKRRPYDSTLMR